jgi:succinate-semialdehyde dehydrogenase / glutarate-semialdehyde dehydrogenase
LRHPGEQRQDIEMTPEMAHGIVGEVHEAFPAWRRTSFPERAGLMRRAADVLRVNTKRFALLMAEEMGKPVRNGIAEVEKCALGCDFFAQYAADVLAPEPIATEARNNFITFQPLGVEPPSMSAKLTVSDTSS